jgi:hypothetical protein
MTTTDDRTPADHSAALTGQQNDGPEMITPNNADKQPDSPRTGGVGGAAIFLERSSYRRRRLSDASRLLPVVGLLVMMVPLLWRAGGEMAMSSAVTYIFVAWAGLIGVAILFGGLTRRWLGPDGNWDETWREDSDEAADGTAPASRVRSGQGVTSKDRRT